ncbi:hypothetical protein ITI46_16365 [Streptomyces oryzae]|uniref:Lipoprotein n=1 Tax=Streptomyces oryzae TaxID=1434886 RepID=A0ABS3XCX3_9ACTN|nr:hypothetical protein [Streptomyces oryzae]MBO8193230.1 hypothetical protein [Streptomyces oryzae]
MNARTTRRVLALVAPLVVLLSACSGGRDYAVPRKVCGVRMSEETVEPLLPDGEKLHQSRRPVRDDGSVVACQVNVVDGPVALDVDITELDKPLTADDKRVSLKSLKDAKSVHVADTHWTVQGDNKIHLSTPCGLEWADSLSFRFTFAKGEKGADATRRNTLRFAKAFLQGEKKKEGCTAH